MSHSKALVAIILLVCIYPLCARAAGHAEALVEMTQIIWETTAILKKIHSVDDARAAKSELMALSQRALDTQKKMRALIGTKIPGEAKRYTLDKLKENETAYSLLLEEGRRLQKDPEIWEVLGESLHGFQ
jgi:hypothetical protein